MDLEHGSMDTRNGATLVPPATHRSFSQTSSTASPTANTTFQDDYYENNYDEIPMPTLSDWVTEIDNTFRCMWAGCKASSHNRASAR